jgi:hypothetical protein
MKKSPFKRLKWGFLTGCIRASHLGGSDKYDLGVTVLYPVEITLDIMCYGPPNIIGWIYVPFVADQINALTKVCTQSETRLRGVSLFHIISP